MKTNIKNHQFSTRGSIGSPIITRPEILTESNVAGRYIPYTGGGTAIPTPNIYPQLLAQLMTDAPLHGAAITKKAKLTYGNGLDFSVIKDPKVEKFLNSINKKNQTINDIILPSAYDLATFGGYAWLVNWDNLGEIIGITHVPFKDVRMGASVDMFGDPEYFVIGNTWGDTNIDDQYKRYSVIPTFNPDKITPATRNADGDLITDENGQVLLNQETKNNGAQLIWFRAYHPNNTGFYPTPEYSNCMDAAYGEVDTLISLRMTTVNSINGLTIISSDQPIRDKSDKRQKAFDELIDSVVGAEASGEVISSNTPVTVQQITPPSIQHHTDSTLLYREAVITAHDIPGILLNQTPGANGFNNRGKEYQEAMIQFMNTNIKGYQNQILRNLNGLKPYMGAEDETFQISPYVVEPEVTESTEVIVSTEENNDDANNVETEDTGSI